MFRSLMKVLWDEVPDKSKPPRRPVLLVGGFEAWNRFIKSQPGGEMSWIEMGDGWGGLEIEGKCGPDGSMNNRAGKENFDAPRSRQPEPQQDRSIVRNVHDYVSLVKGCCASLFDTTFSKQIGNPAARSNFPQPSAPSYSQSAPPWQYSSTSTQENSYSRVNSAPLIAPKPTFARQGSGSASRFDDPYYGFGFNYPNIQPSDALKPLSPSDTSFVSSSLPPFMAPGTSPGTPPSMPLSSIPRSVLPPPLTPKPSNLLAQNGPLPSAPPGRFQSPPPLPPPPTQANQIQRSVTFPPPIPTKPPSVSGASQHMFVPRASSPSLTGGPTRYFGMSPRSSAMPAVPPKPGHLTSGNYLTSSSSASGGETQIGLTGLRNLGNTCFMNSTIQCLSGTVSLARYFLNGSYRHSLNRENPMGTRGTVADGYAALIRTMWQAQLPFVSPSEFREAICQFAPQFRGNEQHDSQEFLAFLMDAIHEDLNPARVRGAKAPPALTKAEEEAEEKLPEAVQSRRAWERYEKINSSIVVRDFQGQLGSMLECLTCGTVS